MARNVWIALVLVVVVGSAACGDSDDGGSDDPVETVDDGGGQDAAGDGDEGGDGDGGAEGGAGGDEDSGGDDPPGNRAAPSIDPDDWVSQIMFASLGITPADLAVSQGDVDCMNAELVTLLPDGLPDDPGSVEAFQAFSDAADTCGATLG
ncbi:MAG: hypothetical protein AAFZ07_20905 [Actinomycetota bacterium]